MSRPSCGQPCTCLSLCHLLFVVCLPIAPASQAKVRCCHNPVAMFRGVRGSTYRPYLRLQARVIEQDTLPVGASVRTSTYYACLPACRCLHVLAQARPMMTCIVLVFLLYAYLTERPQTLATQARLHPTAAHFRQPFSTC